MMKRTKRVARCLTRCTPSLSPVDLFTSMVERFLDYVLFAMLKRSGLLERTGHPVSKREGEIMSQLEYLPIEIGCVCEAKGDGPLGYCYETATAYDSEGDETGPIYFCEAHRPDTETDTAPGYPTN